MKYSLRCLPAAVSRRIILFVSGVFWRFYGSISMLLHGISHGKGVRVYGPCRFLARKVGDIYLGDNVLIESRFDGNYVGLTGPSSFCSIMGGKILIGCDTGLSSVVIHSRASIRIGERCKIGGNVRIFDHDFHSLDSKVRASAADSTNVRTKPVEIGNDVFIGTNALILKGTRIGDRSIVAAGAVIFGLDIPPDSMVKGNPAAIIRSKRN